MNTNVKCIVAGTIAGACNGLLGAGGGLLLVPLLIHWIGMEEKRAFATSLAIMLPLSATSYILYCLQSESVWSIALPYLLGGIIGGALSSKLFARMSPLWLHRLFGALILYGGIKAVLSL